MSKKPLVPSASGSASCSPESGAPPSSSSSSVSGGDWRIPDDLWEKVEPLLPPRKPHPLNCHRERVPDRSAMDGIFFVLRTGCQWGALNATGIVTSSSAHRRFQEWTNAGVFLKLWEQCLLDYDELQGIAWDWLSMDGAMTKAPLGGEKDGPQPYRSRQKRRKTQLADGR